MNKLTSRAASAVLMGLPLWAAAQPDPADPAASAPALAHQSAFSDYKPWQDIQPADWRAVNDNVRAPASAPPSAGAPTPPRPAGPAAAPAPAPQAPAGHHGHGSPR